MYLKLLPFSTLLLRLAQFLHPLTLRQYRLLHQKFSTLFDFRVMEESCLRVPFPKSLRP